MGMFGIRPATIGDTKCMCSACVQLREVPLGMRVGQAAAVVITFLLAIGGAALIGFLIMWGIVAVARQL